jgi:putative transposase
MLIKQAYRFEILRPSGEQIRNMRRFAGTRRYIFNHALALNNEMYSRESGTPAINWTSS